MRYAPKTLVTTLLMALFIIADADAQDKQADWINKNACTLRTSGTSDLDFLSKELAGKTMVALGEASHGTSEFYLQKARMIAYLVQQQEYRTLAFECPGALMEPINAYLQSGQGQLKELMQPLALYNTDEIYRMFKWIRQYNENKADKDKVVLTGFDHADYWADPFTRDKFMAGNVVADYEAHKRKTIVWAHNVHLVKDTTAEYQALGAYLKRALGNQFYVVAFDTYRGSVNVLNEGKFEAHTFEREQNSFSGTLAKAKSAAFFLPLDRSASVDSTIALTLIYSNWQGVKSLSIVPGRDVDALVFIRNTTASVKLE